MIDQKLAKVIDEEIRYKAKSEAERIILGVQHTLWNTHKISKYARHPNGKSVEAILDELQEACAVNLEVKFAAQVVTKVATLTKELLE